MEKHEKLVNEMLLFDDLREKVLYKNRYFCHSHKVLDVLLEKVKSKNKIIEKDTILYRARIMEVDNFSGYSLATQSYLEKLWEIKKGPGPFLGYGKEDCMQPKPEMTKSGRANPIFVSYLYTARDKYTAIYEVKPKLKDEVNIGYIKVNNELKVADFTYNDINISEIDTFIENDYLIYLTLQEFSNVCKNVEKDYILTQFISEFFKHNGYDAIEFNSSLNRGGRNITIFDPALCEAIASEVYIVNNIKFDVSLKSNLFSK